ncbi:hypothetical protein M0R88_00840 [Halorussus gelatinilyticus]|uniref:Uncharacterized protein n=1 Tax=Halorussus gelatinilyticus TaxID=2937524 RepID=A0A8U0IKB2_9EURY|nr:hypothetical protein [Halorussus gelatinilyticus]UPW00664.1 hypothetical protein M0R88_00840 [Halorussus gelatinilyticus]
MEYYDIRMEWEGPVYAFFGVALQLLAWQKYADGRPDECLLALLAGTVFLLVGVGYLTEFTSFVVAAAVVLLVPASYFSLKVHLKNSNPKWWRWYERQS